MSLAPTAKKINVLIVDDDPDILEMLTEIFFNAGYRVITAIDGLDGTFKYTNEIFDIVITDVKMPKKDGVKFVQHIQLLDSQRSQKAGGQPRLTPILLISASLDEYRIEIDLLENIEVQSKPFSPKEVLSKVQRLLSKKPAEQPVSGVFYFKAGEFAMREGDLSSSIFFIKEGEFHVMKKDEKGREHIIAHAHAGELVGEMGFLFQKYRTASLLAIKDCVVISIPKEKFEAVMTSQPKWINALFLTLSTRLDDLAKAVVEKKVG